MPVKGVRYSLPTNIEDAIDIGTLCYFSKMIFAKFECLNLLNEYDTVLFLDYDQVINKDISSLYSPENRNIIMLESDGNLRRQLYSPIPGWDMEINAYCASVMSFSRSIGDYNKMYSWCYERVREYSKYLYAPEQAVFAMLFNCFGVVPETIRLDQYCCHPSNTEKSEMASILHAYGQPKFWNGIKNRQWDENYERWKKMGGDSYKGKSKK